MIYNYLVLKWKIEKNLVKINQKHRKNNLELSKIM